MFRSQSSILFILIVLCLLNPLKGQAERVFCDLENRPDVCVHTLAPVCAFPVGCFNYSCSWTVGNFCEACASPDIIFYLPDECPDIWGGDEQSQGNNETQASKSESGHEQELEYEQSWTGENEGEVGEFQYPEVIIIEEPQQPTKDDGTPIPDEEICPNIGILQRINGKFVEGTFCCGRRKGTCTDEDRPVCGHLYNCQDNNCSITIKNSCLACKDPNVEYFFPVACAVQVSLAPPRT